MPGGSTQFWPLPNDDAERFVDCPDGRLAGGSDLGSVLTRRVDILRSWERHMEAEQQPFEAARTMMLENLERVGFATQTYIDMVERTLRLFPGANQEQIRTFREYIERQVATNRDFMERLLRARDFQEAFRIQVEYFQSQLKTAAEEATQIGSTIFGSFNRTGWSGNNLV
jgi:hypothetical protein